jgi:hypothetical protein
MIRARYSYLSSGKGDGESSSGGRQAIGISKDLEKLPYSAEIKLDANNLYLNMGLGQKRADKRKMAVIFCLYQVILNNGEYYDIVHLGQQVGLDEKQSNSSISIYSKQLGNAELTKENHNGIVEIAAMIRYYCGSNAVQLEPEQTNEILNLYEQVRDQFFNFRCTKKTFVAALVYFWIKTKALSFDEQLFLTVFPGVTIKKLNTVYASLFKSLVFPQEDSV